MSDRARVISRIQPYSGIHEFVDKASHERVQVLAPQTFYDDFVGAGALVISAAGSATNGVPWVKKIVGAAPPTVAGVANAIGGQVACTLTATSEKQDAALYWGDNKGLDVTKGLIFESRFQLSVLPSAAGVQAVLGLASNWIDGPDNNACYLQVGATASGALLVRSFDGVTQISASAGVTLGTTDWALVRIDASDVTDVKMFINGAQVTTKGQINFAATGTLAVLQPYAAMYKPSGTGVGTLTIDKIETWSFRA
ncbi:hypothetical protein [Bradyrhizobium sp. HKCCYLR1051]|uniref:hypothetical protein n=1 Tax=Bradyrhizobium sp. HKCCYLR1051 TaxID=3420738 RepID=UPI003EBD5852